MTLPDVSLLCTYRGIPIYVDEEACAAFGCDCFAVYVDPEQTIVKEFYATEAAVAQLRKELEKH